jgi:hypothetical protein
MRCIEYAKFQRLGSPVLWLQVSSLIPKTLFSFPGCIMQCFFYFLCWLHHAVFFPLAGCMALFLRGIFSDRALARELDAPGASAGVHED